MTTFEYDGSGRMVRAVTVRESEFTPWDRTQLLMDVEASRVRRGAHGIALSESTDPANQFAFEVPPPEMDWAQKALDDAQETYKKQNPNASRGGLIWRVKRRSVA